MSRDRHIFSGTVAAFVFTAVTAVVGIVQLRLLLRFMDAELAGVWLLFLSLGGYLLIFDLGITPTLGREIAFILGSKTMSDEERRESLASLVRSCFGLFVFLSAAIFVLAAVAGTAYLHTVAPASHWPEIRVSWLLFALGTALSLLANVFYACLYGAGDVARERFTRAGIQVLWLTAMYVVLTRGLDLRGLALAWIAYGAIACVISGAMMARSHPYIVSQGRFDAGLIKRMAAPSLRYAATVLGGVLILQTDNLVIASVLDVRSIPGYSAVAKLVLALMTLSLLVVSTSTPFMSRAFAGDDMAAIRHLLFRNLRISLGFMATLGVFLALFADRLIALWIGAGNFIGFPVVWALLVVMFLEANHAAMAAATMATGTLPFHKPALIAGALNLALSVVLARHYGLLGVALGTLGAQLLTNNWYVPYVTMKHLHIRLRDYLSDVVAPVALMLACAVAITAGMRRGVHSLSDLHAVIAGGAVSALLFLALAPFTALSPAERQTFFGWLRRQLAPARGGR